MSWDGFSPTVNATAVVLLMLLQLLGCSPLLGTSLPLTADVDTGLDDLYPIVNGLPPGFVFGTASAAYQVSAARGATTE